VSRDAGRTRHVPDTTGHDYRGVHLAWADRLRLLGGADFGGGIWDLLATGRYAKEQRQAIVDALGPVWEANNVWLIYVIVATWTAFPIVYAAV